ncbi:MAG: DUF362 domain-containing protein [Clostridiales bacterium]|jgi:uncharacterized protein (DUF362 family)|nr:DUF362 domain-containing protein [Clostridiales bacterium]
MKKILAVSVIILAIALYITGCKKEDPSFKQLPPREGIVSAALDPNPVVGIGQGTDYAQVVAKAIENAGGLEGIVMKGDAVLIKPNLCADARAGSSTTTDYRVVAEIVREVKELGAGRVIVAEGSFSGNAFSEFLLGQNKYDEVGDVEFYNFNDCDKDDCYELPMKSLNGEKTIFIPKIYVDADVVISVPKLKTHSMTVVSLSLKNIGFGVPSEKIYSYMASKSALHNLKSSNVIADVNSIRKPDFSVIDGIVGGEGRGPVNNTKVDSQIILASRDPVAVDTVACLFMGHRVIPNESKLGRYCSHIPFCAEQGIGIADIDAIKVVGADLDEIKMEFTWIW